MEVWSGDQRGAGSSPAPLPPLAIGLRQQYLQLCEWTLKGASENSCWLLRGVTSKSMVPLNWPSYCIV
jgi:hypothetical protein